MKKNILLLSFFIFSALTILSCSNTPEEYFSAAVLSTNTIHGFANDGFSRQLESPSVMLSENGEETVTMKRSDVVNSQIGQAEDYLNSVEDLRMNDETKNMLSASIALYEYVLPVYKTDYVQLAELYDNNASPDQIQTLTDLIHEKYFPRFKELHDKLISEGKIYAEKNNINVKWDIKTSP